MKFLYIQRKKIWETTFFPILLLFCILLIICTQYYLYILRYKDVKFGGIILIVICFGILMFVYNVCKRSVQSLNNLIENGTLVFAKINSEKILIDGNGITTFGTYEINGNTYFYKTRCYVKNTRTLILKQKLKEYGVIPILISNTDNEEHLVLLKEFIHYMEGYKIKPANKFDILREIDISVIEQKHMNNT